MQLDNFPQLAKKTWTLTLYYYCTNLCLQFPPHVSVLVIIAMALQETSDTYKNKPLEEIFKGVFSEEVIQTSTKHFEGMSHNNLFKIFI